MTKYIDVLLLSGGVFCMAPPWTVKVKDYVAVHNAYTGEEEIKAVLSVCTDAEGGSFVKMVEEYIGYQLPKITKKYMVSGVDWGDGYVPDND